MLKEAAKTGLYRDLQPADLSRAIAYNDNKYDVVVCVGTFTQAHVGPVALDEFVRVTKPGGYIVATVLGSIYESGGYEAKIESLVNQGKVKLVSADMEDYRRGVGVRARMVVLNVLS
jgi:ubiquinone/menaquinone biosynthesis C-methylase UbiE